jgi:hypothetical protein
LIGIHGYENDREGVKALGFIKYMCLKDTESYPSNEYDSTISENGWRLDAVLSLSIGTLVMGFIAGCAFCLFIRICS